MRFIARIRNGWRRTRRLAVLLPLVALVGCAESFVSEQEDKVARSILPLLQARDYASLEAMLDPAIRQAGPRAQLEAMAALVPPGAPTAVERISFKARGTWMLSGDSTRQVELAYRYRFGDKTVILTVALAGGPSLPVITTAHVLPVDEAAIAANAFTFAGKGFRHYLVFALAIAVPAFILVTLIACIRGKMRRKWAWLIIILFGIGQVSLNWTTGELHFSPFSVAILGAGYFQPLHGPLVIHVATPIGAIIFWIMRRRRQTVP